MKPSPSLVFAACLALVAAAPAEPPPQVVDALFPSGRLNQPIDALLAAHPLEAGKTFQVSELGRDTASSQHLVWIVDREQPHRHDTHDLFVVMLRGWGTLRMGAETKPIGPGSILYIPRATPHAFTNLSGAPAASYAIYFPPFDGKDRVPVE